MQINSIIPEAILAYCWDWDRVS